MIREKAKAELVDQAKAKAEVVDMVLSAVEVMRTMTEAKVVAKLMASHRRVDRSRGVNKCLIAEDGLTSALTLWCSF
jgi:hypothetical protein